MTNIEILKEYGYGKMDFSDTQLNKALDVIAERFYYAGGKAGFNAAKGFPYVEFEDYLKEQEKNDGRNQT